MIRSIITFGQKVSYLKSSLDRTASGSSSMVSRRTAVMSPGASFSNTRAPWWFKHRVEQIVFKKKDEATNAVLRARWERR